MSSIEINLSSLLNFYDIPDKDVRGHASSLKAMSGEEMNLALLVHYFHTVLKWRDARVLDGACSGKGARLDAWIHTGQPESVLYQVEVKSWSVHGYGGAPLEYPMGIDREERSAYRKQSWCFYFEEEEGRYRIRHTKELGKVLRSMKAPRGYLDTARRPLACLWTSLHPMGEAEPCFTVPVVSEESSGGFESLTVFSVSTYLRNLAATGVQRLSLDLPRLNARMNLLAQLFTLGRPSG